jgi:asparagine N-glycosylation enzyme membrane subunit Stt3
MAKFKISPALLIFLIILIFFGVSLLFRVYLPYNQIFVGDNMKYSSNDAYYYMRLVDNVSAHFPHLTQFDPYFIFPGGNSVTTLPLFHWIIAIFAWIFGGGHPTQHLIDVIGAYLPAIMGALTVIPVFFIGKALFNKWAGVLAAGLVAIFPGEFIARSMLGSTDDPVAETLFTAIFLAFLVYAIKTASQNQLTFNNIKKRDWKIILKPLVLSLFAGIFLGVYLATWQGALLFVFIIAVYLIIQFIVNHLHQKSSDYLCIVGFITFLLALIVLILTSTSTDVLTAMVVAILVPLVLYGISKLISGMKWHTVFYPLSVVGIGAIAVLIVYFAAPSVFHSLMDKAKFVFFPSGATAATTTEMTPVLIPDGSFFTTLTAWGNFTTSFFIAPWWLIPGLAGAAICGYIFYTSEKTNSGRPLFVFFIITAVMLVILAILEIRSGQPFNFTSVQLIPGIAFISLSILLYLFIKRDKDQPWYIGTGWVIAFLILLTLMMLAITYVDYRWFSLIPIAIIVYILFKQREGDENARLFIIWSIVILVITMIQRRFQYYFVVNISLLSGYLCWEIIRLSGINRLKLKLENAGRKSLDFSEVKKRDYYEILGVSKSASYKDIKSTYRKLTAGYVPGPNNTPETEARFRELSRVYQLLTNPQQRATYDTSLREASKRKSWQSQRSGGGSAMHYVNVVLAIVVVFLFVFTPNIFRASAQASTVPFALSDDWQTALLWMKNNTPEPLGDPNAYYELYDRNYRYPASTYGVTSWWDYGYWITRVAHRIPSTNPSQDPVPIKQVANFFLSQDMATAEAIREDLGSLYIIADQDTSVAKLPAVMQWAGQDIEKYMPIYYIAQDNQLTPVRLFNPDYYRTLIVRLYNFDGKAATVQKSMVIIYRIVRTSTGEEVKNITDYKEFTNYQDVQTFVASQNASTLFQIVGSDPFVNPIPLDAVEGYQEIFNSASSVNGTQPVKIFEYVGNK